jgi:membrane dipeptidase
VIGVRRSYPYLADLLAPAPQVPVVPLAADVDRVDGWVSEADTAQYDRAARLMTSGPIVSLHDHPVRLPHPITAESFAAHLAVNRDHLGHDGLALSGLTGVFASALGGMAFPALLRWLSLLSADIAHSDVAERALTAADFTRRGRVAVALSLEDLTPIGDDLSGIEVLYGAGVRQAGLTYNDGNALGDGLAEADDHGLTGTGRAAVALMNAIGMVVDLAHVGDRTSVEAAAASTRPVVISHAGSRTVWDSRRMKPDHVLRAVADTGGLIGIEAAPNSTRIPGRAEHDLDAVMSHVEYCVELLGVDHVALGPDTMFGDHIGLYSATGGSPMPGPDGEPAPCSPFVAGMESPQETHRNAAAWMTAHAWTDEDAAKVLGGNVVRLLERTL